MPAIVTKEFKFAQVESFVSALSDPSEDTYIFIGNPIEWPDEADPPLPVDNVQNQLSIWDTIFAVKRVNASNIGKVIKRRNWSSGQVFDYYSSDMGDLQESNFYCLTSTLAVYKCLWNNFGAPSTIQPSGTSTAATQYSDGYIWKYMYSIEAAEALTFLTPEYMPVKIDTNVQLAAGDAAGQVMFIIPEEGGSDYLSVNITGDALRPAVARVSTVGGGGAITAIEILDGGLYTGQPTVAISGGGGATGAINIVANMAASEGYQTIVSFTINNGGSGFTIPTLTVVNGNGTGFAGNIVATNGAITLIDITDRGQDYTFLTLGTTGGTGAVLNPILTPVQGHGWDAEQELGATSILFNTTIILPNAAETGNKYPLSNFYRDVGIISNVEEYGSVNPFGGEVGTNMEYVTGTLATGSGFLANEIVQGTSGGQARVVEWIAGTGTLKLIRTVSEDPGAFEVGHTITGETSNSTLTVTQVTPPDVKKYSGSIKYIEHRTPVSRQPDQFEEIKIVIEF